MYREVIHAILRMNIGPLAHEDNFRVICSPEWDS